jgi:hypothetical protein
VDTARHPPAARTITHATYLLPSSAW